VFQGSTPELPTTTEIADALASPKVGSNLTAPSTAAEGANPSAWVPLIQVASSGYPIVGYTTFDFAQCYGIATVQKSVLTFLKDHYGTTAPYSTDQTDNGFVRVDKSGAKSFLTVIDAEILANKKGWNDNIGNTTACAGLPGR
jgi:phosphate transport system substrate-binding protein